MLERVSPRTLMFVGVVLMLLGVLLPLGMVVKVLTSTFALNFFAYGASLSGMVLAFIGLFSYVRRGRH